MSGIFRFIHLDDRPASQKHLQFMARQMAVWVPDGVNTAWLQNAAVGHALLAVTRESRHEGMPIRDEGTGTLFAVAARLDNRDELCDVSALRVLKGS